jgi:CRISPR/Cas system-associated exonuclease Cas4 (RecB family)
MKVSATDVRSYFRCPRSLWLKFKGIEIPNVGFSVGRQFHTLIHDITKLIFSAYKLELPGKVIETELILSAGDLIGRIDVLRMIERDGERTYIIQDEKFREPPSKEYGRVYPEDKIQIDAYAYLAEQNGLRPVSALIIYNDLMPREVKLKTERIPELVEKIKTIYNSEFLPPVELSESDRFMKRENPEKKCYFCHYYPLCQILPKRGKIKFEEIRSLRFKEETEILKEQLVKSLEMVGRG